MPRGRRQTELKSEVSNRQFSRGPRNLRQRETTAATEYQTSDIGHWGPDSGNVGVYCPPVPIMLEVVCLWKQTLIGLHHITGDS
ncbi:hypothetical protein CDEST_13154 [Colletotrichum destructivum]|uniref:Uncharacterized protein n=1 Tax=Colletotrichum destructivum TaxID=34406 RepID=A0AAX4IY23_9PEZI|nr:hypothetical protein CDEST_13154 [Colletotrichum destructivum]